ncbi:MAG: ABC transporter substrate-binding protein [Microthrixaceae bacterium]
MDGHSTNGRRVDSNKPLRPGRRARSIAWPLAIVAALALVAGACGGSSDDGGGSGTTGGGEEAAGEPVEGGSLVYGLEAESSGGWCLPESQLAVSGIMVARAIYDTLTIPNENAEYVPFLAESVEPNEDFTQWTIKLREGVKFHDGTDLTAEVVKNNIDAWRGVYPGRNPLLLRFPYQPITETAVVDPLTVGVTTSVSWPSFPSYLYYSGRVGIMGQAQLDDSESCDTNLIGTGPFKKTEWVVNDHFSAEKNQDYWLTDDDGLQLPYLESVEFRPFPEGSSRVNALQGGEIQALHTSSAQDQVNLEDAADAGEVKVVSSGEYPEVSYGMLNVKKPPFDNKTAREAAAAAIDLAEIQTVINLDKFPAANGPFGPGEMGYLEDTGFPSYDPERAKELVAQYQEETGDDLEITFTVQNTTEVLAIAQMVKEQGEKVGVKINIEPVEQATLISRAIAGEFEALSFRNHAGGDPDNQYIWWYTDAPTDFSKINDPEIDRLLDEGRAEPDRAKRTAIYEELNKRFASEVYNLWLNWTVWMVASDDNVFGLTDTPMPSGEEPFPGLADGHSVAGAWIAT